MAAVSFKTPPKGQNNQCAWDNIVRATNKLERAGYNGALHLIGSDANAPDYVNGVPTCWYNGTVQAVSGGGCNGGTDKGCSDPVYDNCGGPGLCLDGHWTHAGNNGNNRIDFIFAKRAATAGAASTDRRTIDKGVCSTYSDHCSVRALISYQRSGTDGPAADAVGPSPCRRVGRPGGRPAVAVPPLRRGATHRTS